MTPSGSKDSAHCTWSSLVPSTAGREVLRRHLCEKKNTRHEAHTHPHTKNKTNRETERGRARGRQRGPYTRARAHLFAQMSRVSCRNRGKGPTKRLQPIRLFWRSSGLEGNPILAPCKRDPSSGWHGMVTASLGLLGIVAAAVPAVLGDATDALCLVQLQSVLPDEALRNSAGQGVGVFGEAFGRVCDV